MAEFDQEGEGGEDALLILVCFTSAGIHVFISSIISAFINIL